MRKHIPNVVTLLNLLSGCIATLFAVNDNFLGAALFVFIGIFFDFFDGFLARKLNVQSEIGVQLDSLADLVTSGLVPGILMYKLLAVAFAVGWNSDSDPILSFTFDENLYPLIGLSITLASAYRLAKFNVDDEQADNFIGLPTPANALLILSLPLILEFQDLDWVNNMILNKWFLIGLTILSCYLLNAPIKLLALKFKSLNIKENKIKYLLIILSVILLLAFKFIAIPIIIVLYVLISLITRH